MLEVFRRLGSIQFDPLAVAGRNHDLVLHARVAGYDPAWCDLLYERREIFEAYNKGLSLVPTSELPWFRGNLEPKRAPRILAENADVGRARARADPRGGPAVVARLRARARRDDRLVRGADERRTRRARGVCRQRRARPRATRREPAVLRPARAAASRRGARAQAPGGRAAPAQAAVALPRARPARCRRGARCLRRARLREARRAVAGLPGTERAARGARRATASSFRSRSRACAASASCCSEEVELLEAPPEPPPSVAFLAAVRSAGVGPRPARLAVRLRLRLGALHPAGQAAVGLVRAADPLPRPPRRPHRAAHRPRRRPGARCSTSGGRTASRRGASRASSTRCAPRCARTSSSRARRGSSGRRTSAKEKRLFTTQP